MSLKKDDNVITVSFGSPEPQSEEDRDSCSDNKAPIFDNSTTNSSSESSPQPVPRAQMIEQYLLKLVNGKLINYHEMDTILKAIDPLIDLFPNLTVKAIERVRDEFRGDDTPKHFIFAKQESDHWESSLRKGNSPIPGFDFQAAHAIFETNDQQDNQTRVHFLNPELERPVPTVNLSLKLTEARIFFLIIVRMYRFYYEEQGKDQGLRKNSGND